MVKIEYFNGKEWVPAGGPFGNEAFAWVSLGGDDLNYRTVDENGKVLTDKSACNKVNRPGFAKPKMSDGPGIIAEIQSTGCNNV